MKIPRLLLLLTALVLPCACKSPDLPVTRVSAKAARHAVDDPRWEPRRAYLHADEVYQLDVVESAEGVTLELLRVQGGRLALQTRVAWPFEGISELFRWPNPIPVGKRAHVSYSKTKLGTR